MAAPLPILGAGGALGSSGGRRRGCFPSRSTLDGQRPRGCTAPEPCRKISEALCLPAGDTTQRCRRTALGDTAMAEPRSQGAWPRPSTSRGRARRHAALAWVCACAEEGSPLFHLRLGVSNLCILLRIASLSVRLLYVMIENRPFSQEFAAGFKLQF